MFSNLLDVNLILQAIKTQCSYTPDSNEALLAALTLPKFKLCWVRHRQKTASSCCSLPSVARSLLRNYHHLPAISTFCIWVGQHSRWRWTRRIWSQLQGMFRIKLISLKLLTTSSVPAERPFSLRSLAMTPKEEPALRQTLWETSAPALVATL